MVSRLLDAFMLEGGFTDLKKTSYIPEQKVVCCHCILVNLPTAFSTYREPYNTTRVDIYPKAEYSFLDLVLWNQGPGDLGFCPNSLSFSLDGGQLLHLSEPPLPHLRPSLKPLHLFTRHLPRHSHLPSTALASRNGNGKSPGSP